LDAGAWRFDLESSIPAGKSCILEQPRFARSRLIGCHFDKEKISVASAPSGVVQTLRHDGSKLFCGSQEGVLDSSEGGRHIKAGRSIPLCQFHMHPAFLSIAKWQVYVSDGEAAQQPIASP